MSEFSDLLKAAYPEGWSNREVARAAEKLKVKLSRATVDKYTSDSHGTPTEETIQAFHEVLAIPLTDLRRAAGVPAGESSPWEPPPESDRLTRRQRLAMDELIRSITEAAVVTRVRAPLVQPGDDSPGTTGGAFGLGGSHPYEPEAP